jgi:hypothetical protein
MFQASFGRQVIGQTSLPIFAFPKKKLKSSYYPPPGALAGGDIGNTTLKLVNIPKLGNIRCFQELLLGEEP